MQCLHSSNSQSRSFAWKTLLHFHSCGKNSRAVAGWTLFNESRDPPSPRYHGRARPEQLDRRRVRISPHLAASSQIGFCTARRLVPALAVAPAQAAAPHQARAAALKARAVVAQALVQAQA